MLKTLLSCALILISSAIQAALPAGAGKKVATLPVDGRRMAADPVRPFVYVITRQDELAVIDTTTLKVVKKFLVGSIPMGLALTLDGSKLLVANNGSSTAGLAVVDLQTLTLEDPIALPAAPFDVAAGTDNRAFVVLSNGQFFEVDLTDGSVQEFDDTDLLSLANRLTISPDGATLYVASLGYSPSRLGAFDATTSPPVFKKVVDNAGGNGRDLILSHDGKILTMPSGGGNGDGYDIHFFDASNIEAILGSLEVGPYPHNGAFNLDDTVYYTAPDEYYGQEIQVYSVATQQRLGGIPIGGTDINQMVCESSRRYLFCLQWAVPTDDSEPPFEINVYTTGEKPFQELAGTYALTVTDVTQGYHSATLKLQPTGTYSGSLRAHGRKFAFKGDFLNQLSRTFTFPVAGLPAVVLQVEIERELSEQRLVASFDAGSGLVPLSVLKKTDFKISAPPFAGPFTWYASAEAGEKLGPSTGRIVVNKSGGVTVSGVLGDQTRIAQGGFIADGDKLVLNAPLFGGKGYFGGLVRFREMFGQSDADAIVSWVRPPNLKSKFRPEGFSLVRALRASKYNVPAVGTNVLPFQLGEISVVSDSQTSVPTAPVAFLTRSSLAPDSVDVLSLKAKFSLSTGRFSGSFLLPSQTRRTPFSGYVFQKTNRAIGLFKTAVDYGSVSLVQE